MNGVINIARRQASSGGGGAAPNPDFVSTWDTTQAGSASDTIVLPMTAGPTVHWGDGNSDTTNTHTYASSGTYTVTIEGAVNTFKAFGAVDRLKILDVTNWGGFVFWDERIFQNCTNLDITATDAPTISSANAGRLTFYRCGLTAPNLSTWDWSAATDFILFMQQNASFNGGNISNLIHSGVTSIQQAFNNTPLGNQDLSTWDVSGITNWTEAFRGSSLGALTDISGWIPKGNMSTVFFQNPLFEAFGLETWTIGGITGGGNLFAYTNIPTSTYDATLVAWEAQAPTNAVAINFGPAKYTIGSAAETARTSLISTYGWTITDGGGI